VYALDFITRKPELPEYQAFIDRHLEPETKVQMLRIAADGGTIVDYRYINRVIKTLKAQGLYKNSSTNSCKLLADINFAYKNATGVSKLYDISGYNNDPVQATGANQPVRTAGVQNGRAALVFDGSNDILTIPDSSGFTLSTNGLYISTWMSFTDILTADFQGLLSHYLDADHRWQFYYEKTSGMMFYVKDGVNDGVVISQASVAGYSINTFYHLGITRSANNWNLYRNGTSVKSAVNTFDIQDINAPLTLGNLVDGVGTYVNGKVGGYAIFTTALSDTQRQAFEKVINDYYAIY